MNFENTECSLYLDMSVRDGLARSLFCDWMSDCSEFDNEDSIRNKAEASVFAANAFIAALEKATDK